MHRIKLSELEELVTMAKAACKSQGSVEEPWVQAEIRDNRIRMVATGGHVLGVMECATEPEINVDKTTDFDPATRTLALQCPTENLQNAVKAMPKGTSKYPAPVEISYNSLEMTLRHEFETGTSTSSGFRIPGVCEIICEYDNARLTISALILQAIFKTFSPESETLIEARGFEDAVRITEVLMVDGEVSGFGKTFFVMQTRV